MEKKGFQLNWISKYRTELFGIAILSVMLFHFALMHVEHYEGRQKLLFLIIEKYRYYFASDGVDIFVFLSGMGLYYSFSNNSDLKRFYSRRMKRILIPYAIVGTIFWVRVDIFHRLAGFARLLKDYFYITFFTEGINNLWFVFFIGTMYLMFPLFYACIFRKNTGPILFVLLLAAAIMIPVAVQKNDPDLYHNINIAITRVPIFIIGIAAGKPIKEGKTFPHMAVIALVAVCFLCKYYAVIHDFKRYMFRYSSCIFAMGIMIICVYLLRLLDGAGLFRKILCFFGNNSLEFYLLHILMWELFAEAGIPLYKASRYAVMMCVCIILAPVLNRITGVISRALSAAK